MNKLWGVEVLYVIVPDGSSLPWPPLTVKYCWKASFVVSGAVSGIVGGGTFTGLDGIPWRSTTSLGHIQVS